MSAPTEKLIIFTRYPVAGHTKTRLIESLGAEGAADLQRRMTESVIAEAGKLPVDLEIRYHDGSKAQVAAWLGDNIRIQDQGDGDLGAKLARAFAESFSAGYQKVIITGADCPSLTSALIGRGFARLTDNDLVIGPAEDGGYYLIGLSRSCPKIFQDQPWGTATLMRSTLASAENLGLKYHLLEKLHDVDRPEDLARISLAKIPAPLISVIIPTLNEEETLNKTLKYLSREPGLEIIAVDGGSFDTTPEIAEKLGAMLVHCRAGRGLQQNSGAAVARGEIFLFLHADTILPHNFSASIQSCLNKPEVIAGAFRLAIDLPGAAIRFIERAANFRARVLQMPYGDQALFLRRDVFEQAGGFPEIEIMEDFALVRKLRRLGKIEILDLPSTTSGRRWEKKGILKTTLINQAMILGYLLGRPPASLASWYRSASRSRS